MRGNKKEHPVCRWGEFLYQQKPKGERWKVWAENDARQFSLTLLRPGRWNLTGRPSGVSRKIEKRFDAVNIEIAIEKSLSELGYGVRHDIDTLTIARVEDLYLDSLDAGDDYKQNQVKSAIRAWNLFTDLHKIRFQSEVTNSVFKAYKIWVYSNEEWQGWTPYHYVSKIRLMIKWVSKEWPDYFRDVADGVKIDPPKRDLLEDDDALTFEQVLTLTDDLHNPDRHPQGWRIRPIVGFCGLCGMSVLEALRIRWDQIEMGKYIVVDGEKNEHRRRIIPICVEMWKILETSPREDDPRVAAYFAPDRLGAGNYRKEFYKAFDRWNESLKKKVPRIVPSDLRDVLQTASERPPRWDSGMVDYYVGHSGNTIRKRHYTKRERLTIVKDCNCSIVSKINRRLAKYRRKFGTFSEVKKK